MDLTFLQPAYAAMPVATVVIDTGRGAHELFLRWRALADRLALADAPRRAIDRLGDEVTGLLADSLPAGAVLVGDESRTLLRHRLSEPPAREIADWAPLPRVAEIVRQQARRAAPLPVAAVERAFDREAGDAATGLEAVCRTLRDREVTTLVIPETLLDSDATVAVGPDPLEVAASATELPTSIADVPAVDALVRAAVADRVALHVVAAPIEVAAVLRCPDRAGRHAGTPVTGPAGTPEPAHEFLVGWRHGRIERPRGMGPARGR